LVKAPPQPSVTVTNAILAAGTSEAQLTVVGEGQVITGGVTSTIRLKTCEQVDVFPQASVALYTRVTIEPQGTTWVTSGATVTVGVPQLSVAVASAALGVVMVGLHPKDAPDGHTVKVGAMVSTVYVKVCEQDAEFPHASVAL